MEELLQKVKQNLILSHAADDELLMAYITAAVSYAESYQHFRCIPGVEIKTDQILISDGDRFEIISVEDVKGRGMYTEVLAKKVVAKGG